MKVLEGPRECVKRRRREGVYTVQQGTTNLPFFLKMKNADPLMDAKLKSTNYVF